MTTVYLAGPMSGWPEHNFPAFNRMAASLRAQGLSVLNPAENVSGEQDAMTEEKNRRAHYMRLDIFNIIGRNPRASKVSAVVVLPDWHLSRGARLEVEIALQLDIPVLWAHTLKALTPSDFDIARYHDHKEYLKPDYQGVPA